MEKKRVKFKAFRSRFDNCVCEGCHGTGYVTKLTYPVTLYFNGKDLRTQTHQYWICDECKEKLLNALYDPRMEK